MITLDRPTKVGLKETAWVQQTIKEVEEGKHGGIYEVKQANGVEFVY